MARVRPSYPIESGVPQGSILGPTLFLIYDAEQCLAPGCSLATFADDTTVYTCIGSPELLPNSKKSLQATLDALHDWGKKWRIRFEPTKSQLMTIAHQRHRWPIMDLTFGDHTVSELSEVKLLAITFDSDLSFKTHLHNTALKANSRLGFLRKAARVLDGASKRTVYRGFVRPVLEQSVCAIGMDGSSFKPSAPSRSSAETRPPHSWPWCPPPEFGSKEIGRRPQLYCINRCVWQGHRN